jgi:hypothetical protein
MNSYTLTQYLLVDYCSFAEMCCILIRAYYLIQTSCLRAMNHNDSWIMTEFTVYLRYLMLLNSLFYFTQYFIVDYCSFAKNLDLGDC